MTEEHMKTNIGQYAIIVKDKKLLLLYPPNGPLWVFVGGRLNSDEENYKEALRREVKEETNMDLKNIEPFDIKIWSVNGKNHRYGVFFLCEASSTEMRLSEEHINYKWFSYKEAINAENIGKPGKEVIQKLKDKGLL